MEEKLNDFVVDKIREAADWHVPAKSTARAIEKTRKVLLSKGAQHSPSRFPKELLIMTSRTAAVLVPMAAVLVCLYSSTFDSLAMADVKSEVASTKSVSFKTKIERGESTIVTTTMLLGHHKERKVLANGEIAIRDLAKGESIKLNPEKQAAIRTKFKPAKNVSLYDRVRAFDEAKAKRLPKKKIGMQLVAGFQIAEEQEFVNIETSVWADPKTKLPVQIERNWIAMDGKRVAKETLTNFQFDRELDSELFSLALPEGYTVSDGKPQLIGTPLNK